MSETTEHYQAPADMDETIHLSEYLDVLKKRKWLIIVIALLTLFAAGLASFLMKPVYEAKRCWSSTSSRPPPR